MIRADGSRPRSSRKTPCSFAWRGARLDGPGRDRERNGSGLARQAGCGRQGDDTVETGRRAGNQPGSVLVTQKNSTTNTDTQGRFTMTMPAEKGYRFRAVATPMNCAGRL